MMDTCYYICVQIYGMHNTRNNPQDKYRLWVIMMCRYRFISGGVVDNERSYACVREESIWKISVLSIQLCCEPKGTLEKK